MSDGDCVLAVDGGSQSTKVRVVDADGVVLARARVPLRPYALGPAGRAVHPDDDLWDALAAACRQALAAFADAGHDVREVVAVGLCGIRSCRALVGADGRLVEPVLSWMDTRIGRPVADLDPAVTTVASAGGYLAVRLTGERRDSSASYDGLWPLDLAAGDWSSDPAAHAGFGLTPEQSAALLPTLVPPAGLLGHVTAEAAAATGLPAGLPVHATGNDKAVEALGCGLGPDPDDPTVLLSLGTYVAAMTPGPLVDHDAGGRSWVNAAAVPGRFLHESNGVRRGMWTATWWRRLLAEAADGGEPTVATEERLQSWLEDRAAAVPVGSEGLVTLPDWLAPGHAPHRRGALLGLGAEHGPAHVHRSILEGLVLTMRGHVESLEAAVGRPGSRLVVSGGGSASDLTMRIVADAFGRPAERLAETDAAGTGAAVCAAVGAGLHPDAASAVAAMVRPGGRVEPDPDAAGRYDALASLQAALPGLTDEAFRRLDGVRDDA